MFPICQSDQSLKDSCSLFSIETKHLLNSKYSLSCLTDNVHLYFSIAIILENWPVVSWMDFGTRHFEGHWVAQYRGFGSTNIDRFCRKYVSGINTIPLLWSWNSSHICIYIYNPEFIYPELYLRPHLLLYKTPFQCWSGLMNLNFLTFSLRLSQLCPILLFGLDSTSLKAGSLFQQCWNKELQWCYTTEIKNTRATTLQCHFHSFFTIIVFCNKCLRGKTSCLQFSEHCGSKINDRQGLKLSWLEIHYRWSVVSRALWGSRLWVARWPKKKVIS